MPETVDDTKENHDGVDRLLHRGYLSELDAENELRGSNNVCLSGEVPMATLPAATPPMMSIAVRSDRVRNTMQHLCAFSFFFAKGTKVLPGIMSTTRNQSLN